MATTATQQMTSALAPGNAANGTANTTPTLDDLVDPPNGDEIRRQVEYYFSDDNLRTDVYLLRCCGGRENLPVSIGRIMSFKKMRIIEKDRDIITTALRFSKMLEVHSDGRRVMRKVPLKDLHKLDDDWWKREDIAHDPRTKPIDVSTKKEPNQTKQTNQTKTVYAEGTSKNMLKPTGFEPAWVEGPVTPKEAAQDEILYNPDDSFLERIEAAIQTFKEKRRMHEMYALVFNKLMRFGGVEATPRIFQGTSRQEIAEMDKKERVTVMANHKVPGDRADETKWVVDFAALAKAFLSSWYPAHYGYALDAIKNACQVPRSFYNYLRYHRVCPEYDEQLAEALKICDIAERELPKVHAVGLALPGDFNKSASAIFGGAYAGLYAGDKSWAAEMKKEGIEIEETGIRNEVANIKFGAGVAVMGSDALFALLETKSLRIIEHVSAALEVVEIQLPTDDTKAMYEEQFKISGHKLGHLQPLGKLICKTWYADDCEEWDLPKDRYPDGKPQKARAGQVFEFWIEESILETCFVGLKMDAKVFQLEGGIAILDEVHETMCSFFTWLPNELWMEKKPREVRWLDKRLPGSDEPVVEEDQPKEQGDSQGQGQADEGAAGDGDEFDDEGAAGDGDEFDDEV